MQTLARKRAWGFTANLGRGREPVNAPSRSVTFRGLTLLMKHEESYAKSSCSSVRTTCRNWLISGSLSPSYTGPTDCRSGKEVMMPTPVRQLFETHLTVRDLDRSMAFYRDVLGFQAAYLLRERGVAFFWVGDPGTTMLGLWATGTPPLALKLHTAFSAGLDDVLASPSVLKQAGVEPLDFDGQPTNEPCVLAWMPAAAVYFADPDGHSLEYIAMLPDPPRPEAGIVPYSTWVKDGR